MMKLRTLLPIAIALGLPLPVLAADPATTGTAAPALEQPAVPPAPPPMAVEKPKPVEPPKPVERPRPVVEKSKPALPPPVESKSEEPPPPVTPAEPEPKTEGAPEAATGGGFSPGCWLLSFAMLIIGFAAGFIGRHVWSRRQLGGMTVRIGTWRGIP